MKRRFKQALALALAACMLSTCGVTSALAAGDGAAPAAESQLPSSDPDNSKHWVFDESLSDEFDGTALDTKKWQPIPYTWAGAWRWEDKNVAVGDGKLQLKAQHDKTDLMDESPNGWNSHNMYDGDSVNGEYVTKKYGARTGEAALVYGNFFPVWVRTDATVSKLDPNKTYTLSAWIKKSGNQPISKMFAGDPAEKSIPMNPEKARTVDITENGDFVHYEITGIRPTAAGTCKIGFEMKTDPYAMTVIDDVLFTAEDGSTGNLAPNPSFEDITPMNYSSGGIISRQSMKYGYMETRAKGAPTLPGACSAIWLLGRTENWGTEIDVLEVGQTGTVNELDFAVHTFKTPSSVANPGQDGNPHGSAGIWGGSNSFNPGADYHVYGLEWGPGYQNFYVDGVLRGRFYGSGKGREDTDTAWDQSQTGHSSNMDAIPQNLLLSLGLRPPYRDADREDLNTTFEVDYVRVWRADNTQATGNIKEVNTKSGNVVVPYGTTREELNSLLSTNVAVMLNQAESLADQRDVDVQWNTAGFDGSREGTIFPLTGELVNLPQGVTNTGNVKATLNVYIKNKPFTIDRDALETLVNRKYSEREYSSESWDVYAAAKQGAGSLLKQPGAAQEQIQQAYETLQAAILGLKPIPDLRALVAQTCNAGSYTTESWLVYSRALQKAKNVLANENSGSRDIESAYEKLKAAIDGLAALPLGDNLLSGKTPTSDTAITNPGSATNGTIDSETGWGPQTDKSLYTTIQAGSENTGAGDMGYSAWPGHYLQYDLGSEKLILQLQINRFWYKTDLRAMSFKDCRVEISTTADFSAGTTKVFGPADIAMESDTDVSGNARKQAQVIELSAPVNGRYIRIFGKGHYGGWGNYSARMSYSEIQAFAAPKADASALVPLLEQAAKVSAEGYPQELKQALEAAVAAAQALVKEPTTQGEINTAAAALSNAILAFTTYDKQSLQEKYDTEKTKNEADYTASSWLEFQKALDAAKGVLKDDNATREEIAKAKADLEKAVAGLEKNPAPPTYPAVELTDDASGVSVNAKEGVLPEGVQLQVQPATEGSRYELVKQALASAKGRFTAWDITLLDKNGKVIQPKASVTVTLPAPKDYQADRLNLYRIGEDGSPTELAFRNKDGKLSFDTERLGLYALLERGEGGSGDVPATGDFTAAPLLFACLLGAGISLWFLRRKILCRQS